MTAILVIVIVTTAVVVNNDLSLSHSLVFLLLFTSDILTLIVGGFVLRCRDSFIVYASLFSFSAVGSIFFLCHVTFNRPIFFRGFCSCNAFLPSIRFVFVCSFQKCK